VTERTPSPDQVARAARQLVQTSQLLGVDSVPVADLEEGKEVEKPVAASAPSSAKTSDKERLLEDLHLRHDAECPHCTVVKTHTRTVFGEGNPDARLMFVGEAPGAEEDRTGRPFVGRGGKLLDKIIAAMGIERADVYIANVLKSRPPNNATPTSSEADKCGPYLLEQLGIIEPEVIVTLGKPAAHLLLGLNDAMGKMRGHWYEYAGVPVMPTFHPAYLLRQYTPENRAKVWSDMQQVMDKLGLGPA
jgi:uracil-DNA glycosylase